jgi:hypothetical protein
MSNLVTQESRLNNSEDATRCKFGKSSASHTPAARQPAIKTGR